MAKVSYWLYRTILFFLAVAIFARVLIILPPVQNIIVKQVASYLSDRFETKIEVDHVHIDWFDRMVLEGVRVYYGELEQPEAEIGIVQVNLLSGLWQFYKYRSVNIRSIILMDATVRLYRPEYADNFRLIEIFTPGTPRTKRPHGIEMFFDLNDARFHRLVLDMRDSVNGTNLWVNADNLELASSDFDLTNNTLYTRQISISNSDVKLTLYEGSYVWTDTSEVVDRMGPDSSICIIVDHLSLVAGSFSMINHRIETDIEGPYINFADLQTANINIDISNFVLDGPHAAGKVNTLSFREEKSGFEVTNIEGDALIRHGGIFLENLLILTPHSRIGPSFSMEYDRFSDFGNFVDDVYMRGMFDSSYVYVDDVIAFAPVLSEIDIFKSNKSKRIFLEGNFRGTVNTLRADDLHIDLSNSTRIAGQFRSRNIAVPGEQYMNLVVDELRTTITDLRRLLPGVHFPDEINTLARFNFRGRFDGFFTDFVANGRLETRLGAISSDLRLNLKPGIDLAEYSGKLNLDRFDLGAFLENEDIGPVTFTSSIQGRGLTGSLARAELNAEIREFSFRGYPYNNIVLAGLFEQNLLDIDTVSIRDEHIHLDFSGVIDLTDTLPVFNLSMDIEKLELMPIRFTESDLRLSGSIKADFRGLTVDDFTGLIHIDRFNLQRDTLGYQEDWIRLDVDRTLLGRRRMTLHTEMIEAEIEGVFNFAGLKYSAFDFAHRNYPVYAERFDIKPPEWEIDSVYNPRLRQYEETGRRPFTPADQAFSFKLSMRRSNEWLRIINPSLLSLRSFFAVGYFDNITYRFIMEAGFQQFVYDDLVFSGFGLDLRMDNEVARINTHLQQLISSDSVLLAPVSLNTTLRDGTVQFDLETNVQRAPFNEIELAGEFTLYKNIYQIMLSHGSVDIFDDQWKVKESNHIRFGEGRIHTRNFEFHHNERIISLSSIDQTEYNRGLDLRFRHFDLSVLEAVFQPEYLRYSGDITARLTVQDIFKLEGFNAGITIRDLVINQYEWGQVDITGSAPTLADPVSAFVKVAGNHQGAGEHSFELSGRYYLPVEQVHENLRNTFTFGAVLDSLPLIWLEYLIPEGISRTRGKVSGILTVDGDFQQPNIRGDLNINDAATTLDFLGTRYYVHDGRARVDANIIDFTGMVIHDRFQNTAIANGGIRHRYLKDFSLAASARTSRFEFLNTTRNDNELFYGSAFGAGNVEFSGTFRQPNIFVNATTGPNTRISIPITSEQSAEATHFITFVKRDSEEEQVRETRTGELLGLNFEMELNVTPDAQIQLIFDERTGDIIQGRGRGNLRMQLFRTGEFLMYGDYIIETGDYLFTYQSFINKPFSVRRGGTIQWDGDPYNARIDIEAVYDGLKTAPLNLIAEYITTEQERILATQTTSVEVVLKLTGDLMHPDINFDIYLPELDFALRSYAESKLRTLREDQNELSRQVFGLVVVGSFLPSNTGSLITNPTTTGINTFSQVISNQFSNYLTDLLSQVVGGGGVLSGIDLDINYRMYDLGIDPGIDPLSNGMRTGQELQLGLRNYLFDRRLIVNVGGNFGLGDHTTIDGPVTTGSMITGDIVVEYLLTPDGRLRIRGFQRSQEDGLGERRNKTGMSLSYRKEFDSFGEFAQEIFRSITGRK